MPTKYQSLATRADLQKQVKGLEKQLDPTQNPAEAAVLIRNKDYLRRRVDQQKKRLDAITPPEIKPEERKAVMARKALLEEALRKGNSEAGIVPITSVQQEKSNPDYSTPQHVQWEGFWARNTLDAKGNVVPARNGYGAKFELKDILYREHRDNEELAHEAGSLEYLRSGAPQPLAYMHRPVSFGVGVSKEAYDNAFPDHIPTDVEVKAGQYTEEQRQERLQAQESERCKAITAKGQRCSGKALPGKDYCIVEAHKAQFEQPPVSVPSEALEATA